MTSLKHLNRQLDRIARDLPQPVIVDLSTRQELTITEARQMVKYGAQLVLEGLFEVAQKKCINRSMTLDDHLNFIKSMTLCQEILNTPEPQDSVETMDFSGFTEAELRQYAEFEERAKKVKET